MKNQKDYLLLVFVKPTPFTICCYVEILLKKQKKVRNISKRFRKNKKKIIKQHECEKKKNLLQVSVQNEIR